MGPPAETFTPWLPRVVRLIPNSPLRSVAQAVFMAPLAASHDFSVLFLGFASLRRGWLCPPYDICPQGAEGSKEMLFAFCSLCWASPSVPLSRSVHEHGPIKTILVELCWIPSIVSVPPVLLCPNRTQYLWCDSTSATWKGVMTSLNQLDMSRLQILSVLNSLRMWDSAWATVQPLCSQLFFQCVFQHFGKKEKLLLIWLLTWGSCIFFLPPAWPPAYPFWNHSPMTLIFSFHLSDRVPASSHTL